MKTLEEYLKEYKINGTHRRIVPLNKLCWYCKNGESRNTYTDYYIRMYLVKERKNFIVYRSVKFKDISVGVSRCKKCYDIHQKASSSGWKYILLAVALIGGLITYVWGIFAVIFFLFAIPVAIIYGPLYVDNLITKKSGILSDEIGAKQVPLIQAMKNNNWDFQVDP